MLDDEDQSTPGRRMLRNGKSVKMHDICAGLESQERTFVEEFRGTFFLLGVSAREYASTRQYRADQSDFSKYLRGEELAPVDVVERLIEDVKADPIASYGGDSADNLRRLHVYACAVKSDLFRDLTEEADGLRRQVTELRDDIAAVAADAAALEQECARLQDVDKVLAGLQQEAEALRLEADQERAARDEAQRQSERLQAELAVVRPIGDAGVRGSTSGRHAYSGDLFDELSDDPLVLAVLKAAVDARLLGVRAPQPLLLLQDAAPWYVSDRDREAADSFAVRRALRHACLTDRDDHKLLVAEPPDDPEAELYLVDDDLIDRLQELGYRPAPPITVWRSYWKHVTTAEDLYELARSARLHGDLDAARYLCTSGIRFGSAAARALLAKLVSKPPGAAASG